MPFLEELARFGPDSIERPSLDESKRYCARLTASHYENFQVVTWLTPKPLRPAFASVYSFCRWSDDLGDEVGDKALACELLSWWRDGLRRMYEGQASHPVYVALAETVREFAIPIEPFLDLISAFEQDQVISEYQTFEQLVDYCKRSADPVGRLVLYLGRCFTEVNAKLSDATCTALQLTNFWQDVGRDLDIGRVYLPREDRERFGYTDQDLNARRFNPQFAALMRFEVERTQLLFERGRALVGRMPKDLAVDVELFERGGSAILGKIEAQNYDVWKKRPTLSKWAKAGLLVRALSSRFRPAIDRSPLPLHDPALERVP